MMSLFIDINVYVWPFFLTVKERVNVFVFLYRINLFIVRISVAAGWYLRALRDKGVSVNSSE